VSDTVLDNLLLLLLLLLLLGVVVPSHVGWVAAALAGGREMRWWIDFSNLSKSPWYGLTDILLTGTSDFERDREASSCGICELGREKMT